MSTDRFIVVRLTDEQALAEGDELQELVLTLVSQLIPQQFEPTALSITDRAYYDFILDHRKIELRTDQVYNALIACCSSPGEMPNSLDIARQILTQKRCDCFMGQDMSACVGAAEHALMYHSATSCNVIAHILMFRAVEHRYPTVRELYQMETQLNVVFDPAQSTESTKRPCPGLEQLKSRKAKKTVDQGCCICQGDITRGSDMIKLTPCGHIFHDTTRDCDGIRPWLAENETCPICIEKVR